AGGHLPVLRPGLAPCAGPGRRLGADEAARDEAGDHLPLPTVQGQVRLPTRVLESDGRPQRGHDAVGTPDVLDRARVAVDGQGLSGSTGHVRHLLLVAGSLPAPTTLGAATDTLLESAPGARAGPEGSAPGEATAVAVGPPDRAAVEPEAEVGLPLGAGGRGADRGQHSPALVAHPVGPPSVCPDPTHRIGDHLRPPV